MVNLGVWRPLHLRGRPQRGHTLVVAGRQRDALVVEVPWPAGAGSLARIGCPLMQLPWDMAMRLTVREAVPEHAAGYQCFCLLHKNGPAAC